MERKLKYSFDDEVATKFCYDMDKKKIEIYFSGYFDTSINQYIGKPCIWIIENWIHAKSKMCSESYYDDLENHFGIVSMVLSAEITENVLDLTVNTIDNRYLDLKFEHPELKLV